MAVALHSQTSRTRIGVQASIGTASSNMRDIEVLGGQNAPLAGLVQATAMNAAQVRRRREGRAPVKLVKAGAPVDFTAYVKGLASVLGASATPVAFSNSSALSHQVLLRMGLGGELAPAAGSTVASSSGSPVDEITVASGHGTRFVVGQIIVIERANAEPWVRRVTDVTSDTLTVYPPLDASPATSAVVRNAFCYFPAEYDSTTFTIEHAPVETGTPTAQKRAVGAHGQTTFTLDNGAVAQMAFAGQCLDWQGPDDLSISTDPVADDMGAPLVWTPRMFLGDSWASAPSVAGEVATVKVTIPRKWQTVPGSVINGIGSVHEVAGRDEPITVEVEGLFDDGWWSRFTSDTRETLIAYTVVGTGSSARVFGCWMGRVGVVESPTSQTKDALIYTQAKLQAFLDTTITGSDPAMSVAQIRTANCIFFMG